ncbi:hypothetical protein QVD17_23903 [Tagetes erecta]|uniref:Uncharacterized protein n=1 Tax=Tagetes erecta TaxID=13708 RepID=A0AAD8KKZ1_TARER|nr:hypothetical protein QVD17_23903 [Tagetes erecta]
MVLHSASSLGRWFEEPVKAVIVHTDDVRIFLVVVFLFLSAIEVMYSLVSSQPLMVNLEAQTYETCGKDSVIYIQCERSTTHLRDMCDPDQSRVLDPWFVGVRQMVTTLLEQDLFYRLTKHSFCLVLLISLSSLANIGEFKDAYQLVDEMTEKKGAYQVFDEMTGGQTVYFINHAHHPCPCNNLIVAYNSLISLDKQTTIENNTKPLLN